LNELVIRAGPKPNGILPVPRDDAAGVAWRLHANQIIRCPSVASGHIHVDFELQRWGGVRAIRVPPADSIAVARLQIDVFLIAITEMIPKIDLSSGLVLQTGATVGVLRVTGHKLDYRECQS